MKRTITLLIMIFLSYGIKGQESTAEKAINTTIDAWHQAATNADFGAYFGHMTSDAVFIGTDATENWKGDAFKAFAKPYFDKGKAWSFTSLERNVYLDPESDMAWFDELLDTQMKICRGSGVLVKKNGRWKIKHYVLSVTVPNDDIEALIKIKEETDDALINKLRQKK
ncbi:nuclear transport factor 2 family protein [Sinomicrobium weinanense]|uniref:Nuclear transport factor 2 family protein n=1 Tax=Sinomicrobium weinanense TaxID=2842200 RepID=A0A926Q4F3_9FLAO|nr:nuclear transport factor 2 family protein [Sinomicrobium weinanense]MBC9796825.1 nuclear transport factor 2 family protein [Sinomicrobium weinanense]MBU3123671.1 nuclear transport factor 2 family protein [Sinomicrobium weinanense]